MPAFANATVFTLLDYLTSNILLPMGGFALSLFAGWAIPEQVFAQELRLMPAQARLLQFSLRTIVPACIVVVTLFPLLISKL